MSRGGKRKGAGRKPSNIPSIDLKFRFDLEKVKKYGIERFRQLIKDYSETL